jgi:hypothetical protein
MARFQTDDDDDDDAFHGFITEGSRTWSKTRFKLQSLNMGIMTGASEKHKDTNL